MRHIRAGVIAVTMAAALLPANLFAQTEKNIPAALLGAAAGAGSGGYIAISVIVAESRTGKYMHSYKDALGWRSAPVLIGSVGGVILGLTDPDRLWRTVFYGSAGTLGGVGLGAAVGQMIWDGPEAKWAGGAIGAGLGMAIGSTLGVFLPMGDNDDELPEELRDRGIPITFRIRF